MDEGRTLLASVKDVHYGRHVHSWRPCTCGARDECACRALCAKATRVVGRTQRLIMSVIGPNTNGWARRGIVEHSIGGSCAIGPCTMLALAMNVRKGSHVHNWPNTMMVMYSLVRGGRLLWLRTITEVVQLWGIFYVSWWDVHNMCRALNE